MELLVKLLDSKDTLANILSPHAFRPKRLVYLYDSQAGNSCLSAVRNALLHRFPSMQIEGFPINGQDPASAEAVCLPLIQQGGVFDLTGGEEPERSIVGQFCTAHSVPRFLLAGDPPTCTDLGNAAAYAAAYRPPLLSFEDLAEPIGASVSGSMHRLPNPERFDEILRFFRLTLQDTKGWRQYCNYLQEITDINRIDPQGRIPIDAPEQIQSARHRVLHNDPKFAQLAVQAGFFEEYSAQNGRIRFHFPDKAACYSMITQGIWLEMFCYITGRQSGWFHDCRMSLLFDWNGDPNEPGNVINEIDVLLLRESTPLFLSCKTSVPTTENLNEIFLYAKKFGGSHAKAGLATTAAARQISLAVRNRAKEMGIALITLESLSTPRFLEILRQLFAIPAKTNPKRK